MIRHDDYLMKQKKSHEIDHSLHILQHFVNSCRSFDSGFLSETPENSTSYYKFASGYVYN